MTIDEKLKNIIKKPTKIIITSGFLGLFTMSLTGCITDSSVIRDKSLAKPINLEEALGKGVYREPETGKIITYVEVEPPIDIDMSEYTRLPIEEEYAGHDLDFYINIYKRGKKAMPRERGSIYWNILIKNNSKQDFNIVYLTIHFTQPATGWHPYDWNAIEDNWGSTEIPAGGYLLQRGRGALGGLGKLPIQVVDRYRIVDANNEVHKIVLRYLVQ